MSRVIAIQEAVAAIPICIDSSLEIGIGPPYSDLTLAAIHPPVRRPAWR
jgi:hypothetical protein